MPHTLGGVQFTGLSEPWPEPQISYDYMGSTQDLVPLVSGTGGRVVFNFGTKLEKGKVTIRIPYANQTMVTALESLLFAGGVMTWVRPGFSDRQVVWEPGGTPLEVEPQAGFPGHFGPVTMRLLVVG